MPERQPDYRRDWLFTVAMLALLAAWDWSSLDLALARQFGTPQGFTLRDHWLWSTVLHSGARRVAWVLQLALLLAIWRPFGALRLLTRRQRTNMFVAAMFCLLAISSFKSMNTTSCPWDLAEFGGHAIHVSHWNWSLTDGGPGRCFPAGHASAAFCLLPGFFWLRQSAPRAATIWLIVTLAAGFTLGLAQQVRGAHYLSHTLWTGLSCWVVALLAHALLERRTPRRPLAVAAH